MLSLSLPQSPLRVGFVSPAFAFGGIERWAIGQFRHTRPAVLWSGLWVGSEVTLAGPLLAEAARYVPVFSHHPELPRRDDVPAEHRVYTTTAADALSRLAARCDALVGWGDAPWALLPTEFTGPVVQTSHSSYAFTRGAAVSALATGRVTHTAAVSAAAASVFPSPFREATSVLENGVELDRVAPTIPRSDAAEAVRRIGCLPPAGRIVLYLGRIAGDKAVHLLPEAVAAVPEACLVMAGRVLDRRYAVDLMTACKRLLPGRHTLLPEVDHVGNLLSAAHCVVLSAPNEGGPLVFLEALAAGCPCVTTDVGNVNDIARAAGRAVAVVVPPQPTTDELAAGIRKACSDGRAHARVQAGRRVVWQSYSAAACAERWTRYLISLPKHPAHLSYPTE